MADSEKTAATLLDGLAALDPRSCVGGLGPAACGRNLCSGARRSGHGSYTPALAHVLDSG